MGEEKPMEPLRKILPGDDVLRRKRSPRTRLRISPYPRIMRFIRAITTETPFLKMILLLIVLWLLFSTGIYFTERGIEGTMIHSYGSALYWGIAAFSTAGIADAPLAGASQMIGGIWIVIGSTIFFGTIIATVTTYFLRPMQRPVRQIVDTIEYNLENLQELSVEELELLKETTNILIDHISLLKKEQTQQTI